MGKNKKKQAIKIKKNSKVESKEIGSTDFAEKKTTENLNEIANECNLANDLSEENQTFTSEESSEIVEKTATEELGLSKEYADEKLNEAMQTMAPKKRRKSIIVSLVFLLINVVFMIVIMNNLLPSIEGDIWTTITSRGGNLWWLAGGAVMYALYILVQVLMYYELIKSLTGRKRFKLAYDVAIVGKYYDNVTPFAVGGQPMQIVRLANHGVSAGVSTSIPIIKMIMNNIINMMIALLFFIFGLPQVPIANQLNGLLMIIFIVLAIIGLIITIIVSLFMFLLSSGNFVTRSFISGVLRLGYKMKLVKNYRQSLRKTINQVAEYRNSMKYLMKNKKLFFKMVVLCIFECFTYAMMIYFVIRTFAAGDNINTFSFLIICIVKYYICSMASSYIPLPGGTGMTEISFIFLFSFEVGDFIALALLLWRIVSYYSILIHGFVHETILIGKNLATNRKKKELT